MLSVQNVSHSFGSEAVLDRMSIECAPGEIVAVVGRSGSGKTTLLNIVSGYLPCQSGTVSIDGASPADAAQSQKIGYVFQFPTLMPWLTVRENVALPMQMRRSRLRHDGRSPPSDRDPVVEAALESAHIRHAADKFPHELSGGMQTRASIARAIVYRPVLLLADEPFAALDDIVKESLYQDLQLIATERHMATVLVTHNLTEAALLCDRVYVLGQDDAGGPNRIVHCETIDLGRPRTLDVLPNRDFLRARRRIREALGHEQLVLSVPQEAAQ